MSVLRKGLSPESNDFQNMFLKKPIHFPDLLPAEPDGLGFALPVTAISCKRHPGFVSETHHGVGDALAAWTAGVIDNEPKTEAFVCPICGQDTKPFSGFWNGNWERPSQTDVVMCYQRHTGIDRHTNTVATSIFYVTQAMSEMNNGPDGDATDTWLTGSLWLDDDQLACLREWLSEPIFLGADRTRGMGEVSIQIAAGSEPEFDLNHWDAVFREKVAGFSKGRLPEGLLFSVTLIGHTIWVDEYLRATFDWIPDFPHIEPVTRIIRRQSVHGWHAARNMPKSDDIAIARGSVYLFRYAGADPASLAGYLKELVRTGIGLRRAEGFGRITVCDPRQERGGEAHQASCGLRIEQYLKDHQVESIPSTDVYRLYCPACRTFGAHQFIGRFCTSDAHLDETQGGRSYLLERRDGVAIDRLTGGAASGAKYDLEVLTKGVFKTQIELQNFERWQLGLLGLVLRDMSDGLVRIGMGKSRGLGRIHVEFDRFEIISYGRPMDSLQGLAARCTPHEVRQYGLFPETDHTAALPEGKKEGLRWVHDILSGWEQVLEPALTDFISYIDQVPWPQEIDAYGETGRCP